MSGGEDGRGGREHEEKSADAVRTSSPCCRMSRMPKVCCIFFVLFLGWIWLMLTQVWLLLLQDPDQLEEDHEQETSHLAALQTVAAEMSPVSWRAPIEPIKSGLWSWEVTRNLQVSPGDDSKSPGVEDSNYMMEVPTTSSTSSGLPTTTSNHTNVTSLHRYQQ